MQRKRQLSTVLFVLLFSACTKDGISVGSIVGVGGTTTVASPTGGATVAPISAGGTSGAGSGQGGAAGAGALCAGPKIFASDANNYNVAISLSLVPITAKALTDLTFDWTSATTDLRGRAMVPATDIAMVSVWMFNLNLKGLQTKLNNDSLMPVDLTFTPPRVYYPDGRTLSAKLSELTVDGRAVDLAAELGYFDPAAFPPESFTYAMMVSSGTAFGQGTLMIQAFQVDNAAAGTAVGMAPKSTTLTFVADLRSLAPTAAPVGHAALSLDWSRMSKNALGSDFAFSAITSAFVGHYTQSIAELESNSFLNLDRVATDLFQGRITTSTSVDLATLKTAGGKSFAGIDETDTWLLGLLCDSCRNPAPWYITVLKPCGLTP
jgi:hypothetical protein